MTAITKAQGAAGALRCVGRPEARATFSHLIQAKPTVEAVEAIAPTADDTSIVILGGIARTQPGLVNVALDALNDIDTPQAAPAATSIRRDGGIARGDGNTDDYAQPAFRLAGVALTTFRIRS